MLLRRTFTLDIISVLFWCLQWITPVADATNLYWNHFASLDVPPEHVQYHLRRIQAEDEQCDAAERCQNEKRTLCWGYEEGCPIQSRFSHPVCTKHHPQWGTHSLQDQVNLFWEQGDFGYIKKMKDTLIQLCESPDPEGSTLTCTKNLWYCQAKNLYMDFSNLNSQYADNRYREDVLKPGQVGGYCKFNTELHHQQGKHKSPLQSWFAELHEYSSLPFKVITERKCDIIVDKPTIFMKLDAGINMYHHFCDFVNLFVSQHMNGSFSTDVNIVMWDTSTLHYQDLFAVTWKAFSRFPVKRLDEYDGKKVCFRDAVFSFPPRMIRGLYYNMPLVPDCYGSGLFNAFSHHVLHRLGVQQEEHSVQEFRITLLVRNTKYRNILNQEELIGALRNVKVFHVKVAEYKHTMPFLDQLKITHNTDIFIGMHGAGLTHMLFLPDWAAVFELYNTEDPDCYRDLASLRGVSYITWEDKKFLYQQDEGHHPTLGAHAKFTNYAFNVDEFMRLIYKAADEVKKNRAKLGKL